MTYGIETRELVWDTSPAVFHTGDLVRKLRTAEGRDWTVEMLAEKAGLNKATVSKLERGELDPRKSTLEKIAGALRVPTATLMGDPALTSPDQPVRDDASSQEGVDAAAQLHAAKADLVRLNATLAEAAKDIRRAMDALDALADAQGKRKRA